MPDPQKSEVRPPIKQNRANLFQLSCACGRVLHVRAGRALCTNCQTAHAVRVDSWSVRVEEAGPAAEEPTITAKENLR
jgi:uncharacterized Zn finger protein (UPF0148 family)